MRSLRLALSISSLSRPLSSSPSSSFFSFPLSSFSFPSTITSVSAKPFLNRCSHCYNSTIPFPKEQPQKQHNNNNNDDTSLESGTPKTAEDYLHSLRSGSLINGSKWDYFFRVESTITPEQAYEILTFGRQAKMITPKRYYTYLFRHVSRGEYIPFHIALSAMVRDNVRLTNHAYYILARAGFRDTNLVTRCIAQIDFTTPSSIQLIPEILRLAQFMCLSLTKFSNPTEVSARILRFVNRMPKKVLGAPLYNMVITIFNDRRDAAMTSAIYKDMLKRGIAPDMKTYEEVARGVERREFLNLLQELKQKNIVPSVILYTKILERLCDRNKDTLFLRTLQEMTDIKVDFDMYAYSAAMKGLLQYGHTDAALALLRQMVQGRIWPDRAIFDLLVAAFYGNPPVLADLEALWEQVAVQRAAASEEVAASTTHEVLPVLDEEW